MIAQLGERQTEDLKVPGSIPGRGMFFMFKRIEKKGNKVKIGSEWMKKQDRNDILLSKLF